MLLTTGSSIICFTSDIFLSRITEAWLGVRYVDGKWMWENDVEATEQLYFKDEPFNNVTAVAENICGKAVIESRKIGNATAREISIRQEHCQTTLPIICRFSKLVLKLLHIP